MTPISWSLLPFKASKKRVIPPDPKGVVDAFARIGYTLEQSVADVIDNAIDAEAKNVVVRFFLEDSSIRRIAIVNDGQGLKDSEIDAAMEFGRNNKKSGQSLGKYGMGLKTASFNQCKSVSLLSCTEKELAGRRWTTESIAAGWCCDELDKKEIESLLTRDWGLGDLRSMGRGTIVVWDNLNTQRLDRGHADIVSSKYLPRLQKHLGLVFHRFLSSGRFEIRVDTLDAKTGMAGPSNSIFPLDPFSYKRSGCDGYPSLFKVQMKGLPQLNLEAHIWPSNSNDVGYKLGGGRVSERQGFYFYRNSRLIQAGGWNGWRESDAEPHLSLARVKIDLSSAFDDVFKLNVQKSGIDVPAVFLDELETTENDGKTILQYVQKANDVYRKGKSEKTAKSQVVPGAGVPNSVRRVESEDIGSASKKATSIAVRWKKLPSKIVFSFDRETSTIWANSEFKPLISNNAGSVRLFNTMLYLVLKDIVKLERLHETHIDEMDTINNELLAALGEH